MKKRKTLWDRAYEAYLRCPHTTSYTLGHLAFVRGYLAGYRAALRDERGRSDV